MFETTTLSSLDLIVFGASLAISVCIGLYFANKNKTFTDYATGGGDQNLLAVSVSMALAYCSALTVIGNTNELYLHGASYTMTMTTALIGWPVSSLILLPVFKQLQNVSVFQYLEGRYCKSLRRFASAIYIFMMIFYTSISLYLPCLSLQQIMGIPSAVSIGLTGSVCIICGTFGGLKGITWTNMYHSILLIVTMLIILIGGTHSAGGFSKLLIEVLPSQRLSLGENFFTLDLTTRHTIFNMLIGYLPVRIFLHGIGQNQVQSALSLSTLERSQMSQLWSSIIYICIQVLASSCGLVIYVYYKTCDPFNSGKLMRRDAILMHYLSTKLHYIPAVQGIFIAAVFSATFSSVSTFQSSCSAMVVEDFIRPLLRRNKRVMSDEMGAKIGKLISFALGSVCIFLTFHMHKIDGLIQATTDIFSVFGMPILAAFLLGVLTQFTNSTGIFMGMFTSLVFGLNILTHRVFYGQPLPPSLPISTSGCLVEPPPVELVSSLIDAQQPVSSNLTEESMGKLIIDAVLNQTHTLIEPIDLTAIVEEQIELAELNEELETISILNMSYLWAPALSGLIAISVSIVFSLLTGGYRQTVDRKYLAPLFYGRSTSEIQEQVDDHKPERKFEHDSHKVTLEVESQNKSHKLNLHLTREATLTSKDQALTKASDCYDKSGHKLQLV